MLVPVDRENRECFRRACTFERVMGSRCLCAWACYGERHPVHRFWLGCGVDGEPIAALYLAGGVLIVSAAGDVDAGELAAFVTQNEVAEVDTNLVLATRLQALTGGEMESSYFMQYARETPPQGNFSAIEPHCKLEDVFAVLQQSHEYYRTHLRFDDWAADMQTRMAASTLELYQLNIDGVPVGTGSIASMDDECGVVAAVAVVPAHRGRGYGLLLSKFLTRRICELGRTPRLLSGYDNVAQLYRKIGYKENGRWGELYR